MEAFELLVEAEYYTAATDLLLGADRFLGRWGLGRYLESQYRRILGKLPPRQVAAVVGNMGVLLQNRGEYAAALDHYQRALQIVEELGEREVQSGAF